MGTDAVTDGLLWMLRKHHEMRGTTPDLALYLFRRKDGLADLKACADAYRQLEVEGVLEGMPADDTQDAGTGQTILRSKYRLRRSR